MKPYSMLLSLFLILSLIFNISYASLPPSSAPNLYEIVCRDAGGIDSANPSPSSPSTIRCLKLLKAYPKITSAKDIFTLCKLILEMGIEKGTKGQNYFKELMKKNPSSEAIRLCATTYYDELVFSFKDSLGELVEDPLSANYGAKVAGDGPNACYSILADEKILTPALSNLNSDMSFLSMVAFFATNYLPGQGHN